ncbi:MAG: pectate lyase, partial [Rikenellaceae bacterium]|nr:pectate lyase [Rikenellaceae bacterium]
MIKKLLPVLMVFSVLVFSFGFTDSDTADFQIEYPDDNNGDGGTDPEDPDGNEQSEPEFPYFTGGGTIAFPGAEGFGKNATGARASESRELYRVTNLNASGAGSFADAISQPNRVIIFDVAGVINMGGGTLVLQSNQTILGQTAPGDGVVIYNGRLSSSGASNLIVRYLRVRLGASYPSQADAGGAANGNNQIFDHCSFTWARDENFSLNREDKNGGLYNITLQNSIIGQGLQNHSCGGLIQTNLDEGITIYRNLYIDNESRNPKVKG